MTITASPLASFLGAELRGLDLSCPIDPTTRARILDLFHTHQIVAIRDLEISPERFIRFAELFGPIEPFFISYTSWSCIEYRRACICAGAIFNGYFIFALAESMFAGIFSILPGNSFNLFFGELDNTFCLKMIETDFRQ